MSDYRNAGVDIDAGERFARMIKDLVRLAWPDMAEQIGGFAGGAALPQGATWIDTSADGTGTKIILAALVEDFSGIGQDGLAMAIVDNYVNGSRPFLVNDIIDVAELNPDLHIQIVESLIRGCKLADCVLIGGETAELPDMFAYPWIVNLNVFAVGYRSGSKRYHSIKPKLKVYGWPSYGIASNGFSLVRKVFGLKDKPDTVRKKLMQKMPELDDKTLAEVLLEPTPIWISKIEESKRNGVMFSGHAHITGGGLPGNVPWIIGDEQPYRIVIDRSRWRRPRIFPVIEEHGNISPQEMEKVFNQGIIMISIADSSLPINHPAIEIGYVEPRELNQPKLKLIGSYRDE